MQRSGFHDDVAVVRPAKLAELEKALDHVDTVLIVLGPHGCGKTHALRQLAQRRGLRLFQTSLEDCSGLLSRVSKFKPIDKSCSGSIVLVKCSTKSQDRKQDEQIQSQIERALQVYLLSRPLVPTKFVIAVSSQYESENLPFETPALSCELVKMRPITKANLKKFCKFLQKESGKQLSLDKEQCIIEECQGDLSRLINLFRMESSSSSHHRKRVRDLKPSGMKNCSDTDRGLSVLHAVGKVLHNKLDRDVETLLSHISVDSTTLLSFFQQNYLSFALSWDIDSLASTAEHISESVHLNSRMKALEYGHSIGTIPYPYDCILPLRSFTNNANKFCESRHGWMPIKSSSEFSCLNTSLKKQILLRRCGNHLSKAFGRGVFS
jgi:hypothetical protein